MDPRTGKIDMGLINSGTGSGQRRLREDMRKELMALLDNKGGMKWTEVVKLLSEQSSVKVDGVEFGEVVKGLENEGVLERGRRGLLGGLIDRCFLIILVEY